MIHDPEAAIYEVVDLLAKAEKECDALRARLAEVEAERAGLVRDLNQYADDAHAAESRLAEVEADRDRAQESMQRRLAANILLRERAEAAESRLADVLALCDRDAEDYGYDHELFVNLVRAAATGEDPCTT